MGLTVLEIDVANVSDPEQKQTVEFLIDSGARHFSLKLS